MPRKCIICRSKSPSYNHKTETKPICCADCKLPEMIDVKHKKCKKCNIKIPFFNYLNTNKGIFCFNCKLPEMVDVINRKCEVCKKKRANYNMSNETNPTHCNTCKLDEMVNIITPKCIICKKIQPIFNNQHEKKATRCAACKLPEMVDVINPKCVICNLKQPSYNNQHEKKATHCTACKLPGMVDVKRKQFQCKSCNLLFNLYKKGQDLCHYCNPTKRQKTKELQIYKLLEKHKIEFINDKRIQNSCCYKYRPDFLIDCNSYFIVLEVDEEAHKQYDKDCELIRMNNISYSLGLPVKFIRYNPDNKTYSKKHKEQILITEIYKYIKLNILEDLETVYLFY